MTHYILKKKTKPQNTYTDMYTHTCSPAVDWEKKMSKCCLQSMTKLRQPIFYWISFTYVSSYWFFCTTQRSLHKIHFINVKVADWIYCLLLTWNKSIKSTFVLPSTGWDFFTVLPCSFRIFLITPHHTKAWFRSLNANKNSSEITEV